ncbi:hypothetical protein [Micromonospora sp. C95]|uniref:hypothetical protein n=1 Tax=Micromonospora sp. C95 TaxID=2824882 RepID=UPI001B36839F|nr:hypothetical protein [Micromonospora sp. C95]MBQ1026062.1 hypothetical protein [Micromonospora sp. C95]
MAPYPEHDRIYFTNLLASYGLPAPDHFAAAGRVTFTELVAALLSDLGAQLSPFDLALMTSVTSDSELGWPMCYLRHVLPDTGLAFAVADQGVVAPFTALHLAVQRVRTGGARRVLLVMLDQAALLHDGQVPDRMRVEGNAGVALALDASDTGGAAVSAVHSRRVDRSDVAGLWTRLVGQARDSSDLAITAVCGLGLLDTLPASPPAETAAPAPGVPCTGIWQTFLTRLPQWRTTGRRLLLADYDPELGRLAHCLIDIRPEVPATSAT